MLLYGNVPSGRFVCFCSRVLTKSKGKLKKLAKKPATAEAVSVWVRGEREVVLSRVFASLKKASCPKFKAIALTTVGEHPAQRAPMPSVRVILSNASTTDV